MTRGTYGRSVCPQPAFVGAVEKGHTTEDKQRVIGQIDAYLTQVVVEIYRKMGVADPHLATPLTSDFLKADFVQRWRSAQATIQQSALYPLWKNVVGPIWNDWLKFVSWYNSLWTDLGGWDKWAAWIDKANSLHAYLVSEIPRFAANERLGVPTPFLGAWYGGGL